MIKTFAVLASFSVIILIGCGPSPMDSPPPTAAIVRAELAKFQAYRLERASRGLSTQIVDEQIAIRERQLRAIESMNSASPQP